MRGVAPRGCRTTTIRRFLDDTSAATAIEDGLIACALIGTLQNMGMELSVKLGRISAALS